MSEVSAYFTVTGSTGRRITIDAEGKTPEEIAALIDDQFDGVSLCHQCNSECEDPSGELTGFTLDSVEYEERGGWWVKADV